MFCSRTQHGAACGDRTQDLSTRSPTLDHYATAHHKGHIKNITPYRKGIVSPYPCWKEKHSLMQTKVVTTNTTAPVLDCIKQDDGNSGLLSYFVPENFIDFQCPEVKVHFSNVNLSRVSYVNF